MREKYSPTVSAAYRSDQDWFERYSGGNGYDPDGYDSYGYNDQNYDRAGNYELDYAMGTWVGPDYVDENERYNQALDNWGFDGTKPVELSDHDRWVKRANKMMAIDIPEDSPAIIVGDTNPKKVKKRKETKAQRLEREAAERAAYQAELIISYPTKLMATLERACKLGYMLKVKDSDFVVTDQDDLASMCLSLNYTETAEDTMDSLNWQLDFKEAAEREVQRKLQLKQSALAKLTKEELDALMGE